MVAAIRVRQWLLRACRTYWPLLLVVLVAFLVRLWAITSFMPECTPEQKAAGRAVYDCYVLGGDALVYNSVAENVANGHGYTILSYVTWEYIPAADHPPGYITLLAVLDWFGFPEISHHRFALAIVGSAGVGFVGLLGWRLGGRHGPIAGVVAGLIAALYPGFWMNEAYYMSESWFMPWVALTLLGAYRFWRTPGWVNALLMGFAGGMAWLVRGEAALVLGFICVGFVLFLKGIGFWRKLALGAAACGMCVALMLPWVIYNLNRFPEPIFVAATGTAFALNSCDEVWYGPAAGFYSFGCLNQYTIQARAEDPYGELTDSGLRRLATQYISENLSRYPAVMVIRVGRVFGVYMIDDTTKRNYLNEGRKPDAVIWQQRFYYAMALFSIPGLVSMRRRKVPISPIVATVLAVAAGVAGTFAIFRYRTAADVALCATAGVGIVFLVGLLSQFVTRGERDADVDAGDAGAEGTPDRPAPRAGAQDILLIGSTDWFNGGR
ncbi:MAG: hypothetical protein N2037_02580 [Acidimicrobiales bacterium]|nr:hypothetical protein [Acidimicrobiales bacterium]